LPKHGFARSIAFDVASVVQPASQRSRKNRGCRYLCHPNRWEVLPAADIDEIWQLCARSLTRDSILPLLDNAPSE
jgi:hypothetical protein